MRDALAARGIAVVYQAFEREGHGFRRAETIQTVLESELAFYRNVFGLTA
jgi:dipeptidyl aminopeptidase/acylaminoacyl peptidase